MYGRHLCELLTTWHLRCRGLTSDAHGSSTSSFKASNVHVRAWHSSCRCCCPCWKASHSRPGGNPPSTPDARATATQEVDTVSLNWLAASSMHMSSLTAFMESPLERLGVRLAVGPGGSERATGEGGLGAKSSSSLQLTLLDGGCCESTYTICHESPTNLQTAIREGETVISKGCTFTVGADSDGGAGAVDCTAGTRRERGDQKLATDDGTGSCRIQAARGRRRPVSASGGGQGLKTRRRPYL